MQRAPVLALFLIAATASAQSFNGRSAAEWVGDLAAADAATRDVAVASLVIMGERAVRPALRALDDERPAMRRYAALALGRIGAVAAPAKDKLLVLQQDIVPEVAHAAKVAALRVQVDASALPQVIEALRGNDWELQLAAADVATQLGKAAAPAAAALVELLESKDRALDRTEVTKVQGLRTEYRNVRQSAARALGAIGPVDGVSIVAALVHTTTNMEWAACEGAVAALGSFPGDEQAETCVLVKVVGDDEWPVGRAAAESMKKLFGPDHPQLAKAVGIAALALRNKDGGVRRLAAEFLGGCGAKAASAVPELVRLLASKHNREYGLTALRALGPVAAAAKDALIACCESIAADDESQRREVLETLAAVAPEARREYAPLEQLLAELEKPVPAADVQRQDMIVKALAGLQDASAKVRREAMGRVAELRAVEAIPHLVEWLEGERDAGERAAAIQVLMMLDAEQIVPRVRALLGARAPEVRSAAAHALAMFDDRESMPRVAKVLAEALAFANSDQLWGLGITGVVELAPRLERIVADRSANWRRRWGATQALGYLKAPTSAKVIAAMLQGLGEDDGMSDGDRSQLIAVGLRVLAGLDAAAHRELFTKYEQSDESEVRAAALAGLARCGDAKATAELRSLGSENVAALDVPEPLRSKLETARLRLSQIEGCALRDVLVRLEKVAGMPVRLAPDADQGLLAHRFGGGYIGLIGYHPPALSVLYLATFPHFSGGTLEPRFLADRIELVPAKGVAPEKR
jgi:HEAT repeat protein